MFWIHGGSNLGGSGTGSLYNDGTLAAAAYIGKHRYSILLCGF